MATDQGKGKPRDLNFILDPAILKRVWKRSLRRQLQSTRLKEFEIGHDPLEYAAFDSDLDSVIQGLQRDVRAGTYRAGVPEVVRSGKKTGLTRPLAFLTPRDLLLFKTIILAARSPLARRTKPWVRSGQGMEETGEPELTTETSWFIAWLKRDQDLWRLITTNEWIAETDIANFFPYVSLDGVTAHLHSYSGLSEEVVRLLAHMLRSFGPMPEYRMSPTVGLPQDSFDCSRVIAHSYLSHVDEAFTREGSKGRYYRYVDDFVIGAPTKRHALRQVKKLQQALEGLGLYPNIAKTRVLRSGDLEEEWQRRENDFVGDIERNYRSGQPVDLALFRQRLEGFIKDEGARVKRAWARVLRRYFTVSRLLRDTTLTAYIFDILEEEPGVARAALDYLMSFPLTIKLFERTKSFSAATSGLYEDVDLLLHEYLCLAPNDDNLELRGELGQWSLHLTRRHFQSAPRRAAASCITFGKFATDELLSDFAQDLDKWLKLDSVARQQAVIVLLSSGYLAITDLPEKVADPGVESSRHLRFLRALRDSDERVTGMALNLLTPMTKKDPDRASVRPRALFLAPIVRQSSPGKWKPAAMSWKKVLTATPNQLRDHAAERWLGI